MWRLARAQYLEVERYPVTSPDTSGLEDCDYDGLTDASGDHSYDGLNYIAYGESARQQLLQSGLQTARWAMLLAKRPVTPSSPEQYELSSVELAEVCKWLAVLVGVAGDTGSIEQRVRHGYEFKVGI